jgi:hypothetical protein
MISLHAHEQDAILQQVGVEYCACNTAARKMYNIKFKVHWRLFAMIIEKEFSGWINRLSYI